MGLKKYTHLLSVHPLHYCGRKTIAVEYRFSRILLSSSHLTVSQGYMPTQRKHEKCGFASSSYVT